jgi:FAD:protein FMN transferase
LNRKIITLFAFLFLDRLLFAQGSELKEEGYDYTFPTMGSSMTLSAYASSEAIAAQAFEKARREVERLAAMMTDYDPSSELNRLHPSAVDSIPFTSPRISEELFDVLSLAERWHRDSDGGFDIAIGNLTRLWRQHRKRETLPTAEGLETALSKSGFCHLRLQHATKQLVFLERDVRIDLGGIAAGYIVDRAYESLKGDGLHRCLINIGGDIRCGDPPPGREGWKIEIASIRSRGPAFRRIYLANAAVTTSGDLWQYTTVNGQRRSHILDPRTGLGVLGPMSVTLIAPSCVEADAGATALCIFNAEQSRKFLGQRPSYHTLYLRLDERGDILSHASQNFPPAIGEP